jgi:hypothetical protein
VGAGAGAAGATGAAFEEEMSAGAVVCACERSEEVASERVRAQRKVEEDRDVIGEE